MGIDAINGKMEGSLWTVWEDVCNRTILLEPVVLLVQCWERFLQPGDAGRGVVKGIINGEHSFCENRGLGAVEIVDSVTIWNEADAVNEMHEVAHGVLGGLGHIANDKALDDP